MIALRAPRGQGEVLPSGSRPCWKRPTGSTGRWMRRWAQPQRADRRPRGSERRAIQLPLRFQLVHEGDVAWIGVERLETGVGREVGVARPARARRFAQPAQALGP